MNLRRALVLAGLLMSCREPPPPPERTPFSVALVLPGPVDDHGWSEAGYRGLLRIRDELGARIAFVAGVGEGDRGRMTEVFRGLALEGHDLILGHGGEYIPALEVVAREFPHTQFAAVAAYAGNNRNLGGLSFREGELGYLCGVVAALKTRSRKVAFVGGQAYPHVREQAVLFERGAKAMNPAISVQTAWLDTWTDTERARSVAASLIRSGADVLLVDADLAAAGAFDAVRSAGVFAIGWASDQAALAPGHIITSGIQHVEPLLVAAAERVQAGVWEGRQYKFGLREQAQELADFRGMLTPEQEAVVARVQEDVLTGRVDTSPEPGSLPGKSPPPAAP
ncbi:MAG: BMP family protein [Myxococcota bacterium]